MMLDEGPLVLHALNALIDDSDLRSQVRAQTHRNTTYAAVLTTGRPAARSTFRTFGDRRGDGDQFGLAFREAS